MTFLSDRLLNAHSRAGGGDGEELLDVVEALEAETAGLGVLSLWWLSCHEESLVAARALAFVLARMSRDGAVDSVGESTRVWLLEKVDAGDLRDASALITLATGLEAEIAFRGSYPPATRTSVASLLRAMASSDDPNVRSDCADFLGHGDQHSALQQILNAPLAHDLASVLAERPGAGRIRDLGFLAHAELPDVAPHQERALHRLVLDIEDRVDAIDLPQCHPLISSVRRRALLDEAIARARESRGPVHTVRVLRDDPSAQLLQQVVEFGEAVVRSTRSPHVGEQDRPSYGIHLFPAMAASYPVHLAYSGDDAKEVHAALAKLLKAASKEKELLVAFEAIDPPVLRAAQALLRGLVEAGVGVEVTLTQPTLAEWHQTARSGIAKLTTTVLNRLAKRLREETRETIWLDRSEIPQANSVSLVFAVVSVIVERGDVTHADVDTLSSSRQINYYRHAARILSLLDEDNIPTPRGRAVQGLDANEQMRLGAIYFEDSRVGRAWRTWAGARRLPDLDPATAAAFLERCGVGLSGTTSRRRASTLKKWVEELVPFHYTTKPT